MPLLEHQHQSHVLSVMMDTLQVKDAFGLPLRASANVWWTQDLEGAYQGPNLNQVCVLPHLSHFLIVKTAQVGVCWTVTRSLQVNYVQTGVNCPIDWFMYMGSAY